MSLGFGFGFCLQHVNHVECGCRLPYGGQGSGILFTVAGILLEYMPQLRSKGQGERENLRSPGGGERPRLYMFEGVHRWHPLVRHDLQPAQGGHHIEIGLAVQQHVPMRNAITCQQHIDRAAYRVAQCAQGAVVLGCAQCIL